MIEIGIISIIVLAVGYWVTLWLIGRHDDVLHGDFVHGESGPETALWSDRPFPAQPAFPAKPVFPARPVLAAKPDVELAAVEPRPVSTQVLPSEPLPPPSALSERSDRLQSLLASIKRDLKDASKL